MPGRISCHHSQDEVHQIICKLLASMLWRITWDIGSKTINLVILLNSVFKFLSKVTFESNMILTKLLSNMRPG